MRAQYYVVKYGESIRLTLDKVHTPSEACKQCYGVVAKTKMRVKPLGGNKAKIHNQKWFQEQINSSEGWLEP